MNGSAFDTLSRTLSVAGSRRRAVAAALSGSLAALGGGETSAKKKCPICDICPPPPDTCPQRICCECPTRGACTYLDLVYEPGGSPEPAGTACLEFCLTTVGDTAGRVLVPDQPGTRAPYCDAEQKCVHLYCPVV